MKALSFKAAYAVLITARIKEIETRKWRTNYRGDILICVTKNFEYEDVLNFRNIQPLPNPEWQQEKFIKARHVVNEAFLWSRTTSMCGCAIGIMELYEIQPMRTEHERDACIQVYPGAYAWFIRNIRLVEPFPVKGQLRLFDVPDELIKVI